MYSEKIYKFICSKRATLSLMGGCVVKIPDNISSRPSLGKGQAIHKEDTLWDLQNALV